MIPPDPSGKKTEVANQARWEKAKLNPFGAGTRVVGSTIRGQAVIG